VSVFIRIQGEACFIISPDNFHTLDTKDKYHHLCLTGQVHEMEVERQMEAEGLWTGLQRKRMETEGKTEEGPGIALSCRKLPRGAASLGAPWGYFRQWGFQRAHFHVYLHACYESLAKKKWAPYFKLNFCRYSLGFRPRREQTGCQYTGISSCGL
jgi:hypothetical protein